MGRKPQLAEDGEPQPLPVKEELLASCSLLHQACGLPLIYMDAAGSVISAWASPEGSNPLGTIEASLPSPTKLGEASSPFLHGTPFLETMLIIPLAARSVCHGLIAIGPVCFAPIQEGRIDGLLQDANASFKLREPLIRYYAQLPVLDARRLFKYGLLLYYMIYKQELHLNDLLQTRETSSSADEEAAARREWEKALAVRKHNASYHHHPEWERKMIQLVREGKRAELAEWLNTFPNEQTGILSKKSHLRSQKNLSISGIALITRAAIDGGLHYELAYSLSDDYIQRIEECITLDEVSRLMNRAYFDFCDRVAEAAAGECSHTIRLCKQYIINHIYEELTLEQLAALARLHPNYLSRLFKRETGLSPSVFIQQERIEEAKRLLRYTTLSLADIGTRLGFHDQSYFTKIFKKMTRLTPRQFREQ